MLSNWAIFMLTWFLMVSQVSPYIFDKSPMTSAWRHLHKHKTCRRRPSLSESVHSKSSRCCPSKASLWGHRLHSHFCRNPKVNKIIGNIGSTKQINGMRYLFPILWNNVCAAQHCYESTVFRQVLMVYNKQEHLVLSEFFLTLSDSLCGDLQGLAFGVGSLWASACPERTAWQDALMK